MVARQTSYLKLKGLVEQRQVNIRLILSPPRTSSTLMEAVLVQFEDGQQSCHEPFVKLGYYGGDAEDGYRRILSKVGNSPKDGSVNILVKEMSHWLSVNSEYERLLPLVNDPVLVLIRNPLLSMESRIRKVLQVWQMRERPMLTEWLRENLGKEAGGEDLDEQRDLLDEFALSVNERNWESLLEKKFAEQDYRVFGELLAIESLFPSSSSGWEGLQDEVNYLKQTARDFIVIDSTEFRLAPQFYYQEIARKWNVRGNHQVIRGIDQIDRLEIRMHKPHYRLWYDTLLKNREVRPPTETVTHLGMFPKSIAFHLRQVAIPVYIQTFLDEHRVKNDEMVFSGERVGLNGKELEEIDPYVTALLRPEMFESNNLFSSGRMDPETWKVWHQCYLNSITRKGSFPGRRKQIGFYSGKITTFRL